ncbi:DNA polymerase IV [Pleomorphovibrio marinus]|uniref:DNA polymerase IV n=1 Tax=Pleomorphovibrio marinus TaxID=2164132 RepID=UPI000E0CBEB6|nr:DNA polymerase IV [Pleomorphovibrio marinus]
MDRKIIHIDMDAFFASVEQLDHPDLKGKPVAVGGNKERGVVAAASYEARAFGVRSAMSSKLAAQKCPELVFVKPRFARYKELSLQIKEIFFEYTDLVEPLSLDEAFLDVTANKANNPSATLIAREIRTKILEQIGLTASAGISYNKFLAKVASDLNKPNGQAVIPPKEALAFLERLAIEKFFGIGKVTSEKMHKLGIYSGKDLKAFTLEFLVGRFGKAGRHYYDIVRGIHLSEVKPHRIRKSISVESTFEQDMEEFVLMREALSKLCEELKSRCHKQLLRGRTFTLKIKYKDFTQITRSKSFENPISLEEFFPVAVDLLMQQPLLMPVRLLGIGVSNLESREKGLGKQIPIPYSPL